MMVDSEGIRVERRLIADCAESAATVRCRDLTIESLPGKKTSAWRVKTGIPLKLSWSRKHSIAPERLRCPPGWS